LFDLRPFLCCGGIILTGTCLELNLSITLLNVYGPCVDIKYFWEKVAVRGHLDHQNLILVGDLNFTVDVGEAWGEKAHLDPLSTFVKGIFNDSGLVDVAPDVLVPTWRNGRRGANEHLKKAGSLLCCRRSTCGSM
jgi:hypothetical protein